MSTSEIRDISGWIYTGMWSYCPGYGGAEVRPSPHPDVLPEDEVCYGYMFNLNGMSGTYIENRSHVDPSHEPIASMPLSEFYRPAVVIDVGRKEANQPIRVEDLEATRPDIEPGDAVLLCTGWDRKWEDLDFVDGSPFIHRDAAFWLMDKGIGILGTDFPYCDDMTAMQFPWEEFWDRVGLLLAPVINLTGLDGRCGTLVVFPLKIKGACATPCRAGIILSR